MGKKFLPSLNNCTVSARNADQLHNPALGGFLGKNLIYMLEDFVIMIHVRSP